MIYVEKKPLYLEAFKFEGIITPEMEFHNIFKIEDHIKDFKILNSTCEACNFPFKNHAIFYINKKPQIICPNNYIIINNNSIQIMSIENFEKIYKPLYKDIEDIIPCDFKG